MPITKLFTEHPASVGETYAEHFRVAMQISGQLAGASMACAVHAIVPGICRRTASTKIRELHALVTAGARGGTRTEIRPAPEAEAA